VHKGLIVEIIRGAGKLYQIKLPLRMLTMLIPNYIASAPLRRKFPLWRDINGEFVVARLFDDTASVVSLSKEDNSYWIVLKTKYLLECNSCICDSNELLMSGCRCGMAN
jgi:hypothetical protein